MKVKYTVRRIKRTLDRQKVSVVLVSSDFTFVKWDTQPMESPRQSNPGSHTCVEHILFPLGREFADHHMVCLGNEMKSVPIKDCVVSSLSGQK